MRTKDLVFSERHMKTVKSRSITLIRAGPPLQARLMRLVLFSLASGQNIGGLLSQAFFATQTMQNSRNHEIQKARPLHVVAVVGSSQSTAVTIGATAKVANSALKPDCQQNHPNAHQSMLYAERPKAKRNLRGADFGDRSASRCFWEAVGEEPRIYHSSRCVSRLDSCFSVK
jgi:hypothetical protein